jgi:(+)-trans-carveol dehydrogenase
VAVCDIAEQIPGVPYPMATEADLEETRRLVEEAGGRALAMRADVRDSDQLDRFVDAALAEFERIDILVANAGILETGSWDQRREQWQLMMDVNLTGVWLSCKAAIPAMIERGGGAIVCVSSVGGLRGFPDCLQYGVAKHGVVGLARCLAVDLAPHGIRVNAICQTTLRSPMIMNEPMLTRFTGSADPADERAQVRFRNMHLLSAPWIEAEDVSNAILWLVSDDGRYVTGTELKIDAGMLNQPPGVPPEALTMLERIDAF